MRLNILIGGEAGQGINKVSEIVSQVLVKHGYFTFNYRDYPSLIRGGHNFNILSLSDKRIGSFESKLDGMVALDEKTPEIHQKKLKKEGFVIRFDQFEGLGRNLNVALAGVLIKILGIDKQVLIDEIKKQFGNKEAMAAAEKGLESAESKFDLKKLNNNIAIMTGSQAVAQGAINSEIDLYLAYPMTPATGVLHELAGKQWDNNLMVFRPENEITAVNAALGASFAGAKAMVGTSGGGYDLMTEGLSLQGISEIPLVVYLATRPGPGTGIPTYSSQTELNVALHGGHGEFPRVVIAPGDPIECVEKTNEAFHLAEKFGCLAIVLSDKHLAESEFSSDRKPNKVVSIKVKRKVPGEAIVKTSSYEHDKLGNTTESGEIAAVNAEGRAAKYKKIKEECKKFEMFKIYGNPESKNLVISWGSNKTVILDAIRGEDFKFLHILYLKPLSSEVRKEMEKADNIILVEQNATGQLGRLLREETGIDIEKKILKFDGRPFTSDKLGEELLKLI